MKKLFVVFFILCCFPITRVCAEDITSIHIVSEEWEDYTQADGTGIYWELFRMIYEPVGIQVEFELVPYIRSIKMVRDKQADAAVGVYLGEYDDTLFPKWHFDYDNVSALFKKGAVTTWEGEKSLKGKIGWIRGYGFEEYLTRDIDFVEVDSRKSAFKMLEVGNLDFFLDAEADIENELEKGEIHAEEFQLETVFKQNLYLTFADTERGAQLMKIWDERMTEFIASGELKPLYEKWETDYPFEE